ncbi:MAG: hypothetical protein ACRDNF_08390 [Streptosporangiaceae bacterium]
MSTPLVFQHGAATVAFSAELFAWLVFEAVMRVRQRLRSQGPPTWDPSVVVLLPCLAGSIVDRAGRAAGARECGLWHRRARRRCEGMRSVAPFRA